MLCGDSVTTEMARITLVTKVPKLLRSGNTKPYKRQTDLHIRQTYSIWKTKPSVLTVDMHTLAPDFSRPIALFFCSNIAAFTLITVLQLIDIPFSCLHMSYADVIYCGAHNIASCPEVASFVMYTWSV